jgi:hypothetical protein
MHTAEMLRSDPDFAGLMLRCAEDGIDVLVIVIEPRPPRARPQVKFGPTGNEASYQATVVPPFTALLLPRRLPRSYPDRRADRHIDGFVLVIEAHVLADRQPGTGVYADALDLITRPGSALW